MSVVTPNAGTLTNYEVFKLLTEKTQAAQAQHHEPKDKSKNHRRVPAPAKVTRWVRKKCLKHLGDHEVIQAESDFKVAWFIESLGTLPVKLSKTERLHIVNNRPGNAFTVTAHVTLGDGRFRADEEEEAAGAMSVSELVALLTRRVEEPTVEEPEGWDDEGGWDEGEDEGA